MKPMLKYRGGKSRELSEIKKYIPSFEGRYIEPFFGGGALFFDLEPQNAIINDINKSLMDFYRGIRNDFLDVKSELKKIQVEYEKNREEFDFLKKTTLKKHVENLIKYSQDIANNSVDEQEWYSKVTEKALNWLA